MTSQIITTNTKSFYRPDALPVAQPTVSKHWREKSHSMDLLTPSSPGDLPTLSLTTNSSWLPWGGLPCLSSALWCQYPFTHSLTKHNKQKPMKTTLAEVLTAYRRTSSSRKPAASEHWVTGTRTSPSCSTTNFCSSVKYWELSGVFSATTTPSKLLHCNVHVQKPMFMIFVSWCPALRVVSSEISGGIFPEISGKITVLFQNNSAEKRTCQTPSYFRTMSTFWNVF